MLSWVNNEAILDDDSNPLSELDRAAFVEAAETWRMPYWDMLAKRPFNEINRVTGMCVPKCASTELLADTGRAWEALTKLAEEYNSVADWLKKPENAKNPLYSYEFPADAASRWGYRPDSGEPRYFVS